jgi:hypothetical protein
MTDRQTECKLVLFRKTDMEQTNGHTITGSVNNQFILEVINNKIHFGIQMRSFVLEKFYQNI